jgi:signal transduction histidine kinase
MIADGPTAGGGAAVTALRDVLRLALADPALDIVYARVGSGGWLGELAEQTTAADPGPGRTFTPIDRGGKPIAGIVHDAALSSRPGLLDAAIRAVALALDNEGTKAALRAEAVESQAARARIVEAGERELQRVERNLHDGAQQRLVGLALTLRLASRRAAGDPTVTALLADAAGELDDAIAELRELTRGIHPAIVDDAGLGGALQTLAERPGIPVELHLDDLPALSAPAAEIGAYYVVAEALANTNKHANAQRVTVRAAAIEGVLRVVIDDDGVGGAAASPGSGLEGLTDRVGALGGALTVHSPPGGGTRVTADIPLSPTSVSDAQRRRMAALAWVGGEMWDMPPEAFEQLTDEDNLTDARAALLCAGGNARITEREREWILGYHTAAGTADWVLEAITNYNDSDTFADLLRVPGFPSVVRGAVYAAMRMCAADGPLTPAELESIRRGAVALGMPDEAVDQLHQLVLDDHDLRRRRFEAIAAAALPNGGSAPSPTGRTVVRRS